MTWWVRAQAIAAALTLGANVPPQTVPSLQDYAEARNWAATAQLEGAAAQVAPGARPRASYRDADIFYIHPTTDKSTAQWNTDVEDAAINAWTDASVIARQAAIFNACCRVFAPRYRQATAGTSKAGGAVREDAMALAYGDVRRAFAYYLAHWNRGRPLILAGHSQGAAHLERLLSEEIDGKPLARQLVAAYVVGIAYPASAVGGAGSSLAVCAHPDSVQCVVHWSSVLPSNDVEKTRAIAVGYNRARLPNGTAPQVLCVNPMTFELAEPSASASTARGSVPGDPDATAPRALVRQAVSARCDRGVLVVQPDAKLALQPLPGGSMHYHDLGLFYEDVRENAMLRVQAWHVRHRRRR